MLDWFVYLREILYEMDTDFRQSDEDRCGIRVLVSYLDLDRLGNVGCAGADVEEGVSGRERSWIDLVFRDRQGIPGILELLDRSKAECSLYR